MYNRYIPTEDGSFRRQSLPDGPQPPSQSPAPPSPSPPRKPAEGVGTFLDSLLPRGLDTEDLIVVLLLLLMSENCTDTPNTALITMLIYLFL